MVVRSSTVAKRADSQDEEADPAGGRAYAGCEAVAAGVVVHDRAGRIIYANPAAAEILGIPREQLLALTSLDPRWQATREDGAPLPGQEHPAMVALRTGKPVRQAVMGLYSGLKGGARWILVDAEPVLDPRTGLVRKVVATFTDITARKRAEEALRHSEEFIRLIADAVPMRIAYVDRDLCYRFANRRHCEWLGRPEAEIAGRRVEELAAPALCARVLPRLRAALEGQEVALEDFAVPEDGGERYLRIAYLPHRSAGGEVLGAICVVEDVTERKQLEQRLVQAQKMEAVGALAGGVAHDFNNLLTVITGYSELILGQIGRWHPLARDVEEIGKAAERAAALTRQLLAFSRKQMLQPRVVDMNAVILGMSGALGRLAGERVTVATALAPDLEKIHADPTQVEQVLLNLTVNARDAMPGGGRLCIETRNANLEEEFVRLHPMVRPGRYVQLEVRDTGTGMDAETLRRMFEPFFTTKGLGRGTGLGLSIVYGIVKQSGGYIWASSQPGEGSTFQVYFPALERAAD